jgi:hypothetical protein
MLVPLGECGEEQFPLKRRQHNRADVDVSAAADGCADPQATIPCAFGYF